MRELTVLVIAVAIAVLAGAGTASAAPVPRVERVVPLEADPALEAPGVFFREGFETIQNLKEQFPDTAEGVGKFTVTGTDPFSGKRSLEQAYIGRDHYQEADKGSAGWVARFFGDSPLFASRIADKTQQRRIYARWYHKLPEGFDAMVDGKVHFPPKMARISCIDKDWNKVYSVLFWIENGPEARISIERHTKAPGVHREWLPNSAAAFACGEAINIGRWVQMEMAVILGDGPRSDRVMAWADGKLICDVKNDDLAAGWKGLGLTDMMWDCYWNEGSPRDQSRFYDDLALSNKGPIGPARTGVNPEILLTAGAEKPPMWEVEVAEGAQQPLQPARMVDGVPIRYQPVALQCTTVWKSKAAGASRVKVDATSGEFTGPRAGQAGLAENTMHFVRVRAQDQAGAWSEWSDWHAGFATTWKAGATAEEKTLPRGFLAE